MPCGSASWHAGVEGGKRERGRQEPPSIESVVRVREFADRQNAGDRQWGDAGSAGVKLRDAQWMAFSEKLSGLENRFQWINFLVFDCGR